MKFPMVASCSSPCGEIHAKGSFFEIDLSKPTDLNLRNKKKQATDSRHPFPHFTRTETAASNEKAV